MPNEVIEFEEDFKKSKKALSIYAKKLMASPHYGEHFARHWLDVARYADGAHPQSDDAMWSTITRSSYAVHVWNRKTSSLRFARGSLLHKLHNTWTVLPEHEECT